MSCRGLSWLVGGLHAARGVSERTAGTESQSADDVRRHASDPSLPRVDGAAAPRDLPLCRAREQPEVQQIMGKPLQQIFFHHRDAWSWRELRVIRHWFFSTSLLRDQSIFAKDRRAQQLEVDELWSA